MTLARRKRSRWSRIKDTLAGIGIFAGVSVAILLYLLYVLAVIAIVVLVAIFLFGVVF